MADEKKPEDKSNSGESPEPEELHPQGEKSSNLTSTTGGGDGSTSASPTVVTHAAKKRHASYKPSHRGTFIGLIVVGVILTVNATGLWFILQNQEEVDRIARDSVTLSADSLGELGVSRNSIGSEGVELTVNPDANFGGKVTIAGNTSIDGKLDINGEFNAVAGSFTELQGGETAVESLNVNGDATITDLNLRGDLAVVGATLLQGKVTVGQLMTINNNLNITGSLSVGGSLIIKNLQIGNLTVTGHLIVKGPTPSVSAGGAVGSNGTVGISGNDTGGTVSVNIGVGAVSGILANVTFNSAYPTTPHIVVTPVGRSVPGMYINRTTAGFSIVTPNALGSGGYSFDYLSLE